MAIVNIYFKYADGGLSSQSYDDALGVPATPPGATVLTLAQYNAEISLLSAAENIRRSNIRATETTLNKLRSSSGNNRTVTSYQAPDRLKNDAAYLCDGTADQVQINQAITDAMAEGGGTVHLSAGDFILSDSVLIPVGSGLVLSGSGWESVLKNAAASNRYAIKFVGGGDTRAIFQDFTVDGNHIEQTTGGGGILADGAVQCRFTNLHITSCFDEGLHLGPISPSAFGHNNIVRDCLFDNSMGSAGGGLGIHLVSSDENWILDCDFEYQGGVTGLAAGIFDEAGTQTIANCNFVNGLAGKPAIRVKDCTNTKVIASNFDGVGGTGIFVTGSGHIIADNTMFGVGIIGTPGTSTGIHLEFAAQNVSVSNNTLATHTVDGAAHSLIREDADGGAGNNMIVGNTLIQKGTAQYGLMALNGLDSWVRSNKGAGTAGDEAGPVKVVAGAVSNASFPANRVPPVGTVALDSTNGKLYVKTAASTWKGITLA